MQKNVKNLYTLFILALLTVAVAVAVILAQRSQDIRNRAAGTADLVVRLDPTAATTSGGDQLLVNVAIDNGSTTDHSIRAAGVNLKYDPQVFSITSTAISCGNMLPIPARRRVTSDTIEVSCFVAGGDPAFILPVGGSEILATLTFSTNANAPIGTTQIDITRTNIPDAAGTVDLSDVGTGGTYEVVSTVTSTPTSRPTSRPSAPQPTNTPRPTASRAPTPTRNPATPSIQQPTFTPVPTLPQGTFQIDVGTRGSLVVNIVPNVGVPTTTPTRAPTGPVNTGTPYTRFSLRLEAATQFPEIRVRMKLTDLVSAITSAPQPSTDTCYQPGNSQVYYEQVPMVADAGGTYTLSPGGTFLSNSQSYAITQDGWMPLPNTRVGMVYSLAVKGPLHRSQRVVENVQFQEGQSSQMNFDWSHIPLQPGDLPDPARGHLQDCTVNSLDVARIEGLLAATDPGSLLIADVNYDGVVNGNDISKVVYTLSTKPDDD